MVDRLGDLVTQTHGLEGCAMLRRHPARRPSQLVDQPFAGPQRSSGQVDVKEHWQSVARNQDVRGLHGQVNEAMRMRIV